MILEFISILLKNYHLHKLNCNLYYSLENYSNFHNINKIDYKHFALQENKLYYLSSYLKEYMESYPYLKENQIISNNYLRLDIEDYDYINSFQILKDKRILVNVIKHSDDSFICIFDINKSSNLIKFDIFYKNDDFWSKYDLEFIF